KRKRLVPFRQEWRNQPMTGSAKVYGKIAPSPSRPSNKRIRNFFEIVSRLGAVRVKRERLGGNVRGPAAGRSSRRMGLQGGFQAAFRRIRPPAGASVRLRVDTRRGVFGGPPGTDRQSGS